MRKLVIFLFCLVLLAVATYTAVWFTQANRLQSSLLQSLAKLNDPQSYITYESVETTGFPSDMVVSFVNPRFTGRMDVLLKSLAESMRAQGMTLTQEQEYMLARMPEWHEDTQMEGTLSLRVNALSDRYSIVSRGNWHSNPTIEGQKLTVTTQMVGESACHLQMERNEGLFYAYRHMNPLRDGEQFARDFRSLECVLSAYAAKDTTTQAILISNGGGEVRIASRPTDARLQTRFYVKLSDMEATADGDKLVELYMRALSAKTPLAAQFSTYGKQNIEIDFSYDGPKDFKEAGTSPQFDLSLSTFLLSNNVYSTDATFHASNKDQAGQREAKLALKAVSNFSELYDEHIRIAVRNALDEMYEHKEAQTPQIKAFIESRAPEEAFTVIQPAIPNFSSLGTLTQKLNLTYAGNSDMTEGMVTIPEMEISATAYGISAKGNVSMSRGQLLPSINISLICGNCLRLADDVANYALRAGEVARQFDPNITIPTAAERVEGIKKFLSALSTPVSEADTNGNLHYAVESDGAMGITINGKPLEQVMALYAEHVAPPEPAPAP